MGAGGPLFELRRQGLLEGAHVHADRLKDPFVHDLREGFAHGVCECELLDLDTAARILVARHGRAHQPYRRQGRRRLAIEDLQHGRQRIARFVTGETEPVSEAGRVAHQHPWCDGEASAERRIRQLPTLQDGIDVLVKIEQPDLRSLQRRHRRHRLTDRGCLVERSVGRRHAGLRVRDAPRLRPPDLEVVNHRNADTGHVEAVQELRNGQRVGPLTVRRLRALDLDDPRGMRL